MRTKQENAPNLEMYENLLNDLKEAGAGKITHHKDVISKNMQETAQVKGFLGQILFFEILLRKDAFHVKNTMGLLHLLKHFLEGKSTGHDLITSLNAVQTE